MYCGVFVAVSLMSSVVEAGRHTRSLSKEEKNLREEMRDRVVFGLAINACSVPVPCKSKLLAQLVERMPPKCDAGNMETISHCLKNEILHHGGATELPLALVDVCCDFPDSGPVCPMICKSSLQSISMSPTRMLVEIHRFCTAGDSPGDAKVNACIRAAHHLKQAESRDKREKRDCSA